MMNKHMQKLTKDLVNIKNDPLDHIKIGIQEDNIMNIYCLIYGLSDDYNGGEYIFNIKLAKNHPFDPPDFYFLTPNGRFEINKKLCFSNSSYHKSEWSPIWNLKTIILGFLSFFLENDSKGIGHIQSNNNKPQYALASKEYNQRYKEIIELF